LFEDWVPDNRTKFKERSDKNTKCLGE